MTRLRFVSVLVVGVVGACSLNPQPLPPDNPDGATGADIDATSDAMPQSGDAGFGVDADASDSGARPRPRLRSPHAPGSGADLPAQRRL